jgi:putative tryptophan/tyrosine transport system substrate-binding protein
MKRRRVLLLGLAALASPLGLHAQPAGRMPRIGFLSLQSPESDSRLQSFLSGMRELGYIEGKTIAIEWRFTSGKTEPLSAYAAELVQLKPDLIVAVHPQAVDAVRRLTSTIPIVFTVGQDPVGMGFAKSLARPGGNITGHSSMSADMSVKQIELLRSAMPKCSHVAVLLNPTNPKGSAVLRDAFEVAGRKFGVSVTFLEARSDEEIEKAFITAKKGRVDAVVVAPDGFFLQSRALIARSAIQQRLPSLFLQRESVAAGGLLSYGPDGREQYRRTAYYVHRILNGAKPGDLPIEQPTKFEMIVNLKTAKTLGIKIPPAVLSRADELIQ